MKCEKCGEPMVQSNVTFKHIPNEFFYTRYFCFRCDTLYSCGSLSGDFVEENLSELGEVDYY